MDSTILNVIYGVRWTKDISDSIEALAIESGIAHPRFEDFGFIALPHIRGSDYQAAYCGVLVKTVDATTDLRVGDLPTKPTEAHERQLQDALDLVPQKLRDTFPVPDFWILWSST